MNIGRAQKRICLFVLLPVLVLYLSLRFYAQFCHVDVYVRTMGLMPTNLSSQLPMQEMRINPVVAVDEPYDRATNQILALAEIRRIRSALAWSSSKPLLIDTLCIKSETHVVGIRGTKRFMEEYTLVKRGDKWFLQSATRHEVHRFLPK